MDITHRGPALPLAMMLALAACSEPLDFDLRGRMGGSVDTSQAALAAATSTRAVTTSAP